MVEKQYYVRCDVQWVFVLPSVHVMFGQLLFCLPSCIARGLSLLLIQRHV